MPGYDPVDWLSFLPNEHVVDCVIGHGAILGRQVQIIKRDRPDCKWIQVVHTSPEELGMYKDYEEHISRGEDKHQVEVELCKLADQVVAVGPKLADDFSGYLRPCGKDQDVLNFTPGIFSEFAYVKQATEERNAFTVLVFGRGDNEDFKVKGYDIAAQAIAELKDMTYKLVFVGATRGEQEKVAKKLSEKGIAPSQLRVRRFNESREKLADLFCEADLALMPSRVEGFGLAALEALSAGLPVLVSANSGLAEALKKVPNGSNCVVTSDDPKDWASNIRAVRHKDREVRLGEFEGVRGAYAKKYNWKEQCDKLVERMKMISLEESKKGKRPLSSSSTPASKFPKFLGDEGRDNSVVVKLLKAEYKRRSRLRPLLWDSTIVLPIEQVYTRLKIVSRRKSGNRSKNDEVNVFDIFETSEKGEVVMTLVEGSPGIGKTTFCLKLAYDWAHGNIPSECSFPKFEVVFLLKCRDIDGDIMEAISEQLLPRDMDMEKSVETFLKDIYNQERLLIILDGLDELPEQSRHNLEELLYRRILPCCFVLATTRQERGIEIRKSVDFDIHLEIRGYTEGDAITYVRGHFEAIGQSPKGERLIEEMQQNTLLHALRNNPLNLLLLCVVYEDYEGKLPTSRTELYQVIVRCLLRRYCAKRNLPVPEDDRVLQKTFEKEILALGELAWLCLLSDRYGFRETELVEFERKYPGLVARELGLLYKEESLKRLKPQHEYCFLHKTFQEYVAAAYIAEKLVNQQFNVFEHISFKDFVTKYPQVFIFVSGMLGEKATVLFSQIGEELDSYPWDWNDNCNEEEATFFIESFNESGHAEKMAATLCNIKPFPKIISLDSHEDDNASFADVLMTCRSFLNLQTPVELYADASGWQEPGASESIVNYVQSCLQLTTLSIVLGWDSFPSYSADLLCKWFSASMSLSKFTLKLKYYNTPEECHALDHVCQGLAACRTLTELTFALPGYTYSEGFFKALETGLTSLTSVVLEVRGSMKYTATRALQKFLSNTSLNCLSLLILWDVQEFLVAAVSEALARQTDLKSLDLCLDGTLSSSSASFLEKGLMGNTSLNDLSVSLHGEPPDNWQSVVENLHIALKSPLGCSIHPNTWNNVESIRFRPVVVWPGLNLKQHVTVNVWGDVSFHAANALCEILAASSITILTLNMRGNLTSEVANSIARSLKECKTLSSLSINVLGDLAKEGGIILSSLSKSNLIVQLNVHDVHADPDESKNILYTHSTDNPAALRACLTNVKDTRKESVSLTVNKDSYFTKEWTHCLGVALGENTSLTTLDLTVNSSSVDADLGEDLGKSLLQSPSLTSLSLTFKCCNMREGWLCNLLDCLAKMSSLTKLSLELNDDGEEYQEDYLNPNKLSNLLVAIKSLCTLSVTVNSISLVPFWDKVVGDCLKECTSLKKLSLTFNALDACLDDGLDGLSDGLATTSSLNTLSLAVFVHDCDAVVGMFATLEGGLSLNSSVTTLILTVAVYELYRDVSRKWPATFIGLPMNTSITTLSLAFNEYGEGISDIPDLFDNLGVFEGLALNSSVTTFNLTLNSSKQVIDDWLSCLSKALEVNTSLTILRLKVNSHRSPGIGRLYDFSNLWIQSGSLSLLELDVSFYGKDSGCEKLSIQ